MKKLLILLLYVCSLVTSCYDDSFLNQRVDDLYDRVSTLEERCYQMNEDILALQSIVFALQDNDYITSVTSIKEGGVEIGYTITFAKGNTIEIYHGNDGNTPVIGVVEALNGIYYWTLNGDLLLDNNGNPIKAEGVTPQLKIEGDCWFVSYDNGANWTKLENGNVFIFKSVTQDDDNVYVELSDGTILTVPKSAPLDISFEGGEEIVVSVNSARSVRYTIRSERETTVEVIPSSDIKARLTSEKTEKVGWISIRTSETIDEYSKVVVLVSDGVKVIMKTLSIIDAATNPDTDPDDDPDNNSTYEWVDLGLPSGTLWATTNVGASSPTESGDKFAWGETTPKTDYSWDTYIYGTGLSTFTKYVTSTPFTMYNSNVDGKTTLEASDDAASVNWGSDWRMPTLTELKELVNNCDTEMTSIDDVSGMKFINKNDKTIYIFLPYNDYWSSSLDSDFPNRAHCFEISFGWTNTSFGEDRCNGLYIRPVRASSGN